MNNTLTPKQFVYKCKFILNSLFTNTINFKQFVYKYKFISKNLFTNAINFKLFIYKYKFILKISLQIQLIPNNLFINTNSFQTICLQV